MIWSSIPAVAEKSSNLWFLYWRKERSIFTQKKYEQLECTADILTYTGRTSTFLLLSWFSENKDLLSAYLPDFGTFYGDIYVRSCVDYEEISNRKRKGEFFTRVSDFFILY